MDELPSWHSKGGGFSGAALGHRPQNRAKGADPRTGQRAPTQEPAISKAKSVSARVFCLLPVLACLCRGFPGSGSLVLRPCPFGFLLVVVPPDVSFPLAAGVTFQLPAGGTSGQAQGHRPKNRPFLGIPLYAVFFAFSLRCSRWSCTGLFSSTRT